MKKRFLAGLMVGALFLGGAASAQTDKKIQFRGIEWGLIGNAALEAVVETVPTESDLKWVKIDSKGWTFLTQDGDTVFSGAYSCNSASFQPNDLMVGDYPVNYVQLYFIPSVVDGAVHDSFEESVFIRAVYRFAKSKVRYIATAYYDVRSKLICLYGMPDVEFAIDDPTRGENLCIWYDSSGCSVRITSDAASAGSMDGFLICYEIDNLSNRVGELNCLPVANLSGSVDGL